MKLGKKLEVTDIKERLKMLIDGEVFLLKDGSHVFFDESDFEEGIHPFRNALSGSNSCNASLAMDLGWYYPANTYTINGVELEDNRLSYEEIVNINSVFISDPTFEDMVDVISIEGLSERVVKHLCDNSLVHSDSEAAIAHTKAMVRVEEGN